MPWIVFFPNIHFAWTRLQLDVRLSHFLLQHQPTISLQSKIEFILGCYPSLEVVGPRNPCGQVKAVNHRTGGLPAC